MDLQLQAEEFRHYFEVPNACEQREMQFTLVEEEANKKFLEGMLLLADVKETNEKVRKRWENDGWPGHVN